MHPLPPRRSAHVLGETLEYVVAGSGRPTVVLVNGAGGPVEGWHRVLEPISRCATVLAYDRPGTGRSGPPARPQTGEHLVASLRALLTSAGLAPPYLLVGHSFGGLVVNLFARLHPAEVQAVVLLEASAPADVATMAQHETALQRGLQRLLERLSPLHPHAETRHVQATVAQIEQAPPFPPVPLVVVSGGKPAMAWATPAPARAARAEHQRQLAQLSPAGRQLIATRSGHFPQFSEPALVVSAVQQAAQAAGD